MTGSRTAVDDGTASEIRHRISTPASSIGPWLPDGDLGRSLGASLARVDE
jgi:heptaprenyl diphosphate synthase